MKLQDIVPQDRVTILHAQVKLCKKDSTHNSCYCYYYYYQYYHCYDYDDDYCDKHHRDC